MAVDKIRLIKQLRDRKLKHLNIYEDASGSFAGEFRSGEGKHASLGLLDAKQMVEAILAQLPAENTPLSTVVFQEVNKIVDSLTNIQRAKSDLDVQSTALIFRKVQAVARAVQSLQDTAKNLESKNWTY